MNTTWSTLIYNLMYATPTHSLSWLISLQKCIDDLCLSTWMWWECLSMRVSMSVWIPKYKNAGWEKWVGDLTRLAEQEMGNFIIISRLNALYRSLALQALFFISISFIMFIYTKHLHLYIIRSFKFSLSLSFPLCLCHSLFCLSNFL